MKIVVDPAVCTGHAQCASLAPDVYTVDDHGYNALRAFTVTSGLEEHARAGAISCPEGAITVLDD
jgi:ferredoxin